MAAATRSSDRVAPLPIGASLSVWLRSLLVVISLAALSFFFEDLANGPRGSPCATCWSTPLVSPPLPVRCVPHPSAVVLAPALCLSVPRPNYGAAWPRRTPWRPHP